jgi:hypothetical protein
MNLNPTTKELGVSLGWIYVALLQNLIRCSKQSYTGSLIEYNLHFPPYNLAPVT